MHRYRVAIIPTVSILRSLRLHLIVTANMSLRVCKEEQRTLKYGRGLLKVGKQARRPPEKSHRSPCSQFPSPAPSSLHPSLYNYSGFKKMQTSQRPWLSWDMARLQPASGRNWVESPGHTRLAREGRPEPFCGPQSLTTKCMGHGWSSGFPHQTRTGNATSGRSETSTADRIPCLACEFADTLVEG